MKTIKEIIPDVLHRLQNPENARRCQLSEQWQTIVGPKISGHTRPALGNKGDLYVWVDQSTLAFELRQKYRQTILKRTQAALGEEAVKTVYFKVGQLR